MNQLIQLINKTRKYLTEYDYEKVIENCDRILEIDNSSGFALRFKAISYFQLEQYEKAIEIYTKLYRIFSEDEELPFTLAYMYECLGKYDESLDYLERCGQADVIDSRKKRLLTKMGQYNQIINEYNLRLKQINHNPSTDELILKMQLLEEKAIFLLRSGEYDKAYDIFVQVDGIYRLVKNKSNLLEKVGGWYGRLSELLEKYTGKEFFNHFLLCDKKIIRQWDTRLELKYGMIGDPLVYCDLLLEMNPDNVDVLRISAMVSKYIDYDYSLECWNKILEIEPENTEAIMEILNIYSYQYSKDRSLKLIDSKLHLESIKVYLLEYKIRLLESMTLYDDALKIYDEYLSIADENETSSLTISDKIRCMELKALLLYENNKVYQSYTLYKEILETFITALDSNQFKREPGINTIEWYTELLQESVNKSDDNPLIFFEELFKVNEDNVNLWKTKILSFIYSDRYRNSINLCNILLQENPNNIRLELTKAEVFSRTHMLAKAYDIYNKVLELDSENSEAKNNKFNILVRWDEFEKAYTLLKTMKIEDSSLNSINKLANKYFYDKEYSKALYCYNILMDRSYGHVINKIKCIWQETGDTESQNESKYYMDWIDIINFKYDKQLCPKCNSELIPIIYGLPLNNPEEQKKVGVDYMLGGCCVGRNSPHHYCKKCEEGVYFGNYGIDLSSDDCELFDYTSENIYKLVRIIGDKQKITLDNLQKLLYSQGIDEKESLKFVEKLESINFIKADGNVITLVEGYNKFNKYWM